MSKRAQTELKRMIRENGLRRLARLWGVDPSYLCRVASGQQNAGPAILTALGIKRRTVYQREKNA